MRVLLVLFLFMSCFYGNARAEESCQIANDGTQMFLSWVGDKVSFKKSGEKYVITIVDSRFHQQSIKRRDTDTSVADIVNIWPTLAAERINPILNFREADSSTIWSFSVLTMTKGKGTTGMVMEAKLLSSAVPDPKLSYSSIIVSSEGMPAVGYVADLLMFYTPSALAAAEGADPKEKLATLQNSVKTRVDVMNSALRASRIPGIIRLVGIEATAFDENLGLVNTLDAGAVLQKIVEGQLSLATDTNSQALREMNKRRVLRRADLVSVVLGSELYEEQKKVCNEAIPASGSMSAFSVIRYRCEDNDASLVNLAQALGTNFGAKGDRATLVSQGQSIGASDYSFAYVDKVNRFRTLTSAPTLCQETRVYCPLVPLFSSADPEVRYAGKAIGNAANDAARVMTENFPKISNYIP